MKNKWWALVSPRGVVGSVDGNLLIFDTLSAAIETSVNCGYDQARYTVAELPVWRSDAYKPRLIKQP